MILVVLGTWEMPFTRPLKEIDRAAQQGLITEPIIVQCGNTKYSSKYMQLVPFFGQQELEMMYERATFVICQAGVGSIMLGLEKRKKVIAIARLARFDEHIDDHQLEILDVFTKSGAVLPWNGNGDLTHMMQRIVTFVPAEYAFAPEQISGVILNYLSTCVR
jgi:UDP-N-acetylglucosamine transferase subunit ALG13